MDLTQQKIISNGLNLKNISLGYAYLPPIELLAFISYYLLLTKLIIYFRIFCYNITKEHNRYILGTYLFYFLLVKINHR